jgi:hypothetical protein
VQSCRIQEAMASREPYIVGGQVVRDSGYVVRRHYWQYISWRRVWFILIATTVLAATNLANQEEFLQSRQQSGYYSKKTMSFSRKVTNYGIFSVEEKFDSIIISAMQQSWVCSYNDINIGHICDMAGKCSGMCMFPVRRFAAAARSNRSFVPFTSLESVSPKSNNLGQMGSCPHSASINMRVAYFLGDRFLLLSQCSHRATLWQLVFGWLCFRILQTESPP